MDRDTRDLLIISWLLGLFTVVGCAIWGAAATGEPWPARHPIWSGVIVMIGVAIIGRVYLFMRRLEDHNR